MTEKTCPRCQQTKPATEFYVSKNRPDGLSSYCKPCAGAHAKAKYEPRPREKKAPEGFKFCPKCKTVKPVSEFGKNKNEYDGLQGRCKPCCVAAVTASRHKDPTSHRESSKRWREKNPERHADNHARWLYGVPHGTYAKMLEAQGGKCAICGAPKPGGRAKRFHIDHCHNTSEVRGLLCSPCNTGIGQLKHSVDILLKAISYLSAEGR